VATSSESLPGDRTTVNGVEVGMPVTPLTTSAVLDGFTGACNCIALAFEE